MLIKIVYTKDLEATEIHHQLHKKKSILIKDFPLDDLYFENFIPTLGTPVHEIRNIRGKSVFNVEVAKQNNFFRSIANSNLGFPLHTDCADFKEIPDGIALLCIQPAPNNQGVSHFTSLSDIIEKLTPSEIELLLHKKWIFRDKQRSILTKEGDAYRICYDRITMESFSEISEKDLQLLNKLDTLFNDLSFSLSLEQGDLILFRNDIILHGRSGFDIDAKRLLQRVRFYIHK